jgi:hypothetical protein
MSGGCRLATPQLLLHSALPCRNQHTCIKVEILFRPAFGLTNTKFIPNRESPHYLCRNLCVLSANSVSIDASGIFWKRRNRCVKFIVRKLRNLPFCFIKKLKWKQCVLGFLPTRGLFGHLICMCVSKQALCLALQRINKCMKE